MPELPDVPFRVYDAPHFDGTVPTVETAAGVQRRATEEEAFLWRLCAEQRRQLDAHEKRGARK